MFYQFSPFSELPLDGFSSDEVVALSVKYSNYTTFSVDEGRVQLLFESQIS